MERFDRHCRLVNIQENTLGEGSTILLVLVYRARDDAAVRCGPKGFVGEDYQEDSGARVYVYERCRV